MPSEQVAAAHDGTELGIGDATLMNALATATGRSRDKVRRAADAHVVSGAHVLIECSALACSVVKVDTECLACVHSPAATYSSAL